MGTNKDVFPNCKPIDNRFQSTRTGSKSGGGPGKTQKANTGYY